MHRQPAKNDFSRFCFIIAGIMVVAFFSGGTAIYYRLPPYDLINNAFHAIEAREEQAETIAEDIQSTRNFGIDDPPQVIHKAGAYEGYTLYTTDPAPGATTAMLIDMDGHVLHRWSLAYSKNPHPVKDRKVFADPLMYWFDLVLSPNGDLLAVYHARGYTPYGYGLVKLDKDSNVIWSYGDYVNHCINVRPDGSILALVHDITPPPEYPDIPFADKSIINDWVVFLTPEGKEIKRISLLDAIAKSDYSAKLQKRVAKEVHKGDILHPNSVMELTPEMAKHFPMFKAGQILVSIHNMGLLGMLDPDAGKFVWMTGGIWRGQHHAEFMEDGTILLLDNYGSHEHQSRILKYDPVTDESEVLFTGNQKTPFETTFQGMQQMLPNGNLLIAETNAGRMFEVNRQGDIVWQMINPYHNNNNKAYEITVAKRYLPEELPFLKDAPQPPAGTP